MRKLLNLWTCLLNGTIALLWYLSLFDISLLFVATATVQSFTAIQFSQDDLKVNFIYVSNHFIDSAPSIIRSLVYLGTKCQTTVVRVLLPKLTSVETDCIIIILPTLALCVGV